MVDLNIITKVLRKFLSAPRNPRYLNKPEYAHLKERNKELYLSSSWYSHHWSYNKFLTYVNAQLKGSKYFVCGLPYQLPIKENLLDAEQVKDEMSEDDFDEIAWSMEMECLFFGESDKAYFKYEDLDKNRKLPYAMYSPDVYDLLKEPKFKFPQKQAGEIRLLSSDIAGMAGKANDASVYSIIRLIPNSKGYDRHIAYMENVVGGHTVTQAIRIRQMFDDYDCDYIVLDTQNIGLSIFDQLTIPLFDKERNKEYDPISCINDEKMAERCTYPSAPKVVYSIKASASLNSDIAVNFRDGLRRGKIKLLISELDAKDHIKSLKGYDKLPEEIKAKLLSPNIQTTALINEMINLEGSINDLGQVKLKEPSGKRKDRYSSVSYGNYVATILERDLLKEEEQFDEDDDLVYF